MHLHKPPGLVPFTPNDCVDITGFTEAKKQVLEAYSAEMRQPPHSRSVENAIRLNGLRGNAVGVPFVEGFKSIRLIK